MTYMEKGSIFPNPRTTTIKNSIASMGNYKKEFFIQTILNNKMYKILIFDTTDVYKFEKFSWETNDEKHAEKIHDELVVHAMAFVEDIIDESDFINILKAGLTETTHDPNTNAN